MADLNPSAIKVDASEQVPADRYRADLRTCDAFLEAATTDQVSLKVGYTDPEDGVYHSVGVVDGDIREYELAFSANGVRPTISGRDNMVKLLENVYRKNFLLKPPPPQAGVTYPSMVEAGQASTLGAVPYEVGSFMAQQIATQIVASVGLSLSWECRDYVMQEDFSAVGRPYDLLAKLVEPWCWVERTKVDIFCQGSVIICRERAGTLEPDYVVALTDARIDTVTWRKKRGPVYGVVTLRGKPGATRGGSSVPTDRVWQYTDTKVNESKDQAGSVMVRVETATTYWMPAKLVAKVIQKTWTVGSGNSMALFLTNLKRTFYKYDKYETIQDLSGDQLDSMGAVPVPKNPRLLSQNVLQEGIHKDDKKSLWRELATEYTHYAYGQGLFEPPPPMGNETPLEGDFMELVTTDKKALNLKKGIMERTELVTRSLRMTQDQMAEQITTVYKPVKGSDHAMYEASVDTQPAGGQLPGGHRPGAIISSGGGQNAAGDPIEVTEEITIGDGVTDVTQSNNNLLEDDLNYIMDKFREASGLWEHTVDVAYCAMPQLRKCSKLQVTGLETPEGVPVEMGVAIITDMTLFHAEQGKPQRGSTLTAKWWS